MSIDSIITTMLNGEPIHDGITIGIIFICFYTFYEVIFGSLFSIFKKQ